MKRRDVVRHMVDHGCELVREGGNHSWWGNPALNQRSAVPRHREIPDNLVKKICATSGFRLRVSLKKRENKAMQRTRDKVGPDGTSKVASR